MNNLSWFTRAAKGASRAAGRPLTFMYALAVILVWSVTGPFFHFSDTWQLVINTGTTIITFLMVFLIQSTQNRDTEALRIKLDEEELEEIRSGYLKLAQEAREKERGINSKGRKKRTGGKS